MKNSIPPLVACALSLPALAADRLVPSQYSTIQAAIDAAAAGDAVLIAAGSYPQSFNTNGKAILVCGSDPANPPLIVGRTDERSLSVTSGELSTTVVRDIAFAGVPGGILRGGGAFISGSSPTIERCRFEYITNAPSAGTWGGAVDVASGSPLLRSCRFVGNRITSSTPCDGGALVVRGGSPTIESCHFADNGGRQGADLFAVGVPSVITLAACEYSGSSGGGFGARIYNYGPGNSGTVVILRDCVFRSVSQSAVSLVHGWDEVRATGTRFLDCNLGTFGGALFSQSRNLLSVTDSEFRNNACGGVISIDPTQGGHATVRSSRFCGGQPAGPDFGPQIADLGGNSVNQQCCVGDILADSIINGADLGAVLSYWGPVTSSSVSRSCDLNGDGVVNGADLGTLLANWGPCS